jgi:hypothetical protein
MASNYTNAHSHWQTPPTTPVIHRRVIQVKKPATKKKMADITADVRKPLKIAFMASSLLPVFQL